MEQKRARKIENNKLNVPHKRREHLPSPPSPPSSLLHPHPIPLFSPPLITPPPPPLHLNFRKNSRQTKRCDIPFLASKWYMKGYTNLWGQGDRKGAFSRILRKIFFCSVVVSSDHLHFYIKKDFAIQKNTRKGRKQRKS